MSFVSYYRTIKSMRRASLSLFISGIVLLLLSTSLIPCTGVSLYYEEDASFVAIPMIVGFILGFLLITVFKLPERASRVNVLYMLGSIWAVTVVFGASPYVLGGLDIPTAIFESTSGYTTTGGSAIADLSVLTEGLLFHRVMTNWMGGIIIIISVMILLPMIGSGNRSIISNEISGSGMQNMQMKIKDVAIQFIKIYVGLSAILCLILMLLSISPLDAISITFSTISTGGFSSFPMTDFNIVIDFTIMFFMFMGATNFYLHFRAIKVRRLRVYGENGEFMLMLVWYLLASTAVFLLAYHDSGMTLENYVNSMFMVVSAGTTTGFACVDYMPWPTVAIILIFVVALFGGSSGSTAGGLKIYRLLILLKCIPTYVSNILHPNSVNTITLDKQQVSNATIRSVLEITALFLFTIVLFTFIFMIMGLDAWESITAVVTALTNYGPGVNQFGPMASFAPLSHILKLLMALLMWLGRLEIILALAMFLPSVWREQMSDVRQFTRNRGQENSSPFDNPKQ